jgi:hypothetical protein
MGKVKDFRKLTNLFHGKKESISSATKAPLYDLDDFLVPHSDQRKPGGSDVRSFVLSRKGDRNSGKRNLYETINRINIRVLRTRAGKDTNSRLLTKDA